MRKTKNSSSVDPSGTHVWLVLMKAYRSVMHHAQESMAVLGLGPSDFVILEMLLNKGPQKVNDIGRKVDLTSGSITTAVDRLGARGLVTREVNQVDSRSRIVHLTDKGRSLISDGFAAHSASMEKACGGVNIQERTELIALLKKLGLYAQAHFDESIKI